MAVVRARGRETRRALAGDEELRQRLAAGDDSALSEVYDRFAPLVYGLAFRVTRSREAAEDIAQEVFTFIWERPLGFDPARGSLRSWLGMIAHRRAVEFVRREESRRRAHTAAESAQALHVPQHVDDEVIAADVRTRVQQAVARLPQTLRETVELAYFRGRTYRQVAVELGLPEGTAKSRIRLGLRRMAGDLERQGLGVPRLARTSRGPESLEVRAP